MSQAYEIPDEELVETPLDDVDFDESGEDDVAILPVVDAVPDTDGPRELTFRAGRNLTSRLDKYLVDRIGYLSRVEVQRLIKEKVVTVNGRPGKSSYNPRENDVIVVSAPPPKKNEIEPEDIPLDVIFEDEHLLAINKQADLIVHPARGRWHGTLVNGLVHYAKQWSTVRGAHRPGILHRLDKNTTGVMLVAKTDEAHWRLGRQFENRTIKKTYLAIAHGIPQLAGDIIDMPIGPDAYVRERMGVRKPQHGGKSAITQYQIEESFPVDAQAAGFVLSKGTHASDQNHKEPPPGFSLIRLKPLTGRTHQLRVHLSYRGHPILGDTMYGGRAVEHHIDGQTRHFARQALHAAEISFVHPRTLQQLTLAAPLPGEVLGLLGLLRAVGANSQPVDPLSRRIS